MAFQEFTGELDSASPSGPVQEFSGELDGQPRADIPQPSTGDMVLRSSIPRGVASLLNTPVTLGNLLMMGIEKASDMTGLDGVRDAAKFMREGGQLDRNIPMEAAERSGIVDPTKDPQGAGQKILDTTIQSAINSLPFSGGKVEMTVDGLTKLTKNVLRTLGVGGTSGGVGQAATELTQEFTGNDTAAKVVGAVTGMATSRGISGPSTSKNPFVGTEAKKDILKEAQSAGYKIEPSLVRERGVVSKVESVAGKGSLSQAFSIHNQKTTNALAAKSIGLPPTTELSKDTLKQVRDNLAAPYREIEKLRASNTNLPWFPNYHSTNLLHDLRDARQKTSKFWDSYYRTGDLKFQESAEQMAAHAKQIEDDIEMIAKASGKPKLVEQLQKNRQVLARTYDIEEALQKGTLEINAAKLQRMYQDGRPLSGELELIAKFEQAYGRDARIGSRVPPPNVSGTDAAAVPILTMAGTGTIGAPGIMAGGLPLLRGPARRMVLSDMIQKHLLKDVPPVPTKQAAARALMTGKTVLENNP